MMPEVFLIKDHLNRLGFEKIDSVCVCLFAMLYIVRSYFSKILNKNPSFNQVKVGILFWRIPTSQKRFLVSTP